jgi:hypothetical protein
MKNKILLFILLGLFLISFTSATLTDGLITYYGFEETSGTTAIDSVNLNNGSHLGGVVVNQDVMIGQVTCKTCKQQLEKYKWGEKQK